MRKILLSLVILYFFAPSLLAAPAYGTDLPAKGRMRVGYQANVVIKHELKEGYGKIDSVQHYYDVSYGVLDWFVFDGKLGIGDTNRKGGNVPDADYGYSFAGGYGFRARLYDDKDSGIKVVGGFHHISVHPRDEDIGGDRYESFLDDWQIDLLCSKKFGRFTPYAGGKASVFEHVYRINKGDRKRVSPKYNGGAIAGFDFNLKDDITVNVEGRFIDEDAVSAGIYYSF
jgi:opacity protein-like surface antigen